MTEEQLAAIEARITHALRNRAWADSYIEDEAHSDLPALVAEVRRLQELVPPPGSIVVTNPCDRCLHDRVTHLDIGDMVCESPCDCPGFVPRGMEAPK